MVEVIRRETASPVDINNLAAAITKVNSDNKLDLISGVIMIRRIMSFADTVYLPQVVQSGILPRLH